MIHRLTYNRANHDNIHVHGFCEKGTTTTPFDMAVINGIDRYHLAIAAIEQIPILADRGTSARQSFHAKLIEHHRYVREHGQDMPEVQDWHWQGKDTID